MWYEIGVDGADNCEERVFFFSDCGNLNQSLGSFFFAYGKKIPVKTLHWNDFSLPLGEQQTKYFNQAPAVVCPTFIERVLKISLTVRSRRVFPDDDAQNKLKSNQTNLYSDHRSAKLCVQIGVKWVARRRFILLPGSSASSSSSTFARQTNLPLRRSFVFICIIYFRSSSRATAQRFSALKKKRWKNSQPETIQSVTAAPPGPGV